LHAIRVIRDHGQVVKLNEKAEVPIVDGAARERLVRAFDRDGVVAAMLRPLSIATRACSCGST
jgi:hypothetical protein